MQRAKNRSNTVGVTSVLFLFSRDSNPERVSGLFEVRRQERLLGKHVLLVDDVFTTGATIMACASAVAAVPGTTVSIMTLGFTK